MKTLSLVVVMAICATLKVAATGQCGQARETSQPGLRSEMLVSTDWLAEHLHDPDLVLLCVATAAEFCDKGRIPGARFLAVGSIAVTRDGVPNELPPIEDLRRIFEMAGVNDASRVVLYGERYGLFAARAYYTLDYMGLARNAALLNGGLEKWKTEGRSLTSEPPKIQRGKLMVKSRPEILIDLNDMQAIVLTAPASATIIDARPAEEFSGLKISEDVPVAGHISHAAGLYFMRLLESPANPVLRPEAELRELFKRAGAVENRKVVTYCRSGMQSSFDYFVAKYLGYEAAMYDGSFHEWSHHGLPVVKDSKP
jgi:thiosulfate/3-mercaptopyruvate sulfurtransferase